MSEAEAEADRAIGNLVSIGRVTAIDHATGRVRVQIGDLASPSLQVMQIRSGTIKMHWMPAVGEQVTIYAPSGDLSRGFIGGSLPVDGNMVAPDAGTPTMDLSGGTLRVVGTLHVEGDITVSGDVTAGAISLRNHRHGGVVPGPADTGVPK